MEVTTRAGYLAFEQRLGARGYEHDRESGVICRFRHQKSGLVLDAMPLDPRVLGFENRWQEIAAQQAVERDLPSGQVIRVITPEYLLATKLEAFRTRGKGDFLASRDFGDILALLDGRAEIAAELAAADSELRQYVAAALSRMRDDPLFASGAAGALLPDEASQSRLDLVVRPRIDQLIAASP